MGWWVASKSASWCSIFQAWLMSTDITSIEELSLFLSLGGKWITCWIFHGNFPFEESQCWLSILQWLTGSRRRMYNVASLLTWTLIVQQHLWERNLEFKHDWRRTTTCYLPHCHRLQLAIVQAACSTRGIKHVYTTPTTLWKFFYHSQGDIKVSRRCTKYWTSLSLKFRNFMTLCWYPTKNVLQLWSDSMIWL